MKRLKIPQSNTGPTYVADKGVLGSFHQGNRMLGDTAGTQCVYNLLYAVCQKLKGICMKWFQC